LTFLELSLEKIVEVVRGYRPLLIQHADLVKDLLTSKEAVPLLRAFAEDEGPESQERLQRVRGLIRDFLTDKTLATNNSRIKNVMEIFKRVYEDDGARNSLLLFRERWKELAGIADPHHSLNDAIRPILEFFENEGLTEQQKELSRKVRHFVADLMIQGELDQLLILEPEKAFQILKTLHLYVQEGKGGDLQKFLEVVWRSLSEKK
jgi:hypothetical protein